MPGGTARKVRRLRGKTDVQEFVGDLVLADEESNAVRAVYLPSFPHPTLPRSKEDVVLVAPGTLNREQVRGAVLRACAEPEYEEAWLPLHPKNTSIRHGWKQKTSTPNQEQEVHGDVPEENIESEG